MSEMITMNIQGEEKQYPKGIIYETIADEYQNDYDGLIGLVRINGKIRELRKIGTRDAKMEFIDLKSKVGHSAYVRTAMLMLVKAFHDVIGRETGCLLQIQFTIGSGYFCEPTKPGVITPEVVAKVKEKMVEYVKADLPISKKSYPIEEANELFASSGLVDKEKVFRFRLTSSVNVYELDGYYDYYFGYMLPSTKYVPWFDVLSFEGGIILNLPKAAEPKVVPTFEPRMNLFKTLCTAEAWGDDMEVDTVGDLNEKICEGKLNDLILVQEALQERRIAEIASDIASREGVKFVMIAGPSSSGKTTFSHRMSVQLSTHGLHPHPIGLDDYYLNRDECPRDENGDYDFECLEALDVEQFNKDMLALLAGERVELPSYNFKTGKREYRGHYLQLGKDDILVIEGIHGLNEKMSYSLPSESKYRIYISALTTLNIDYHNRIPTTDGRLLRRMVRDYRTRGTDARRTIEMWPSVRRGEEAYIFPFQENADAMFNSALIYELAVLKPFAEPLLFSITPDMKEYDEAKRLLKFLGYFLSIDTANLPNNSLVREFVGGGCFGL